MSFETAGDIAAALAAGRRRAGEVVEVTLARIERDNKGLNAFTAVTADRARTRAAAIDAARAAGKPVGPLAVVPFAVKNLIDIVGLPTIARSYVHRDDTRF
jgi:aspartyl-tRNA(Asn)/glutamyl-tRNA(Gln) amidotransferase subunit A